MQKCNVSPKGGRGVLPPPFPGLYPLMWSLECIKFFDLVNFVLFSYPFPVSFGGNTEMNFLAVLDCTSDLLVCVDSAIIQVSYASLPCSVVPRPSDWVRD